MRIVQNGVEVYCLPDIAYCDADDEKRSPIEIDECPMFHETCDGDCIHYHEEWDPYEAVYGNILEHSELLNGEST